MTTSGVGVIDLADPRLYEIGDPVSAWAYLRTHSPVYWNRDSNGGGFWAVTRYGDAVEVYKNTRSFSSQRGMRLGTEEGAASAAAGRMLIVTDPPRHAKIRQAMNAAFTPRMVARLETTMRQTMHDLLAAAVARRELDFVTEIAATLPVSVISDMMGVPREDWPLMVRLTSTAFGSTGASEMEKRQAHADIFLYYAELVERRRAEPGDDIVSALTKAVVDGQALTDEEIILNCDGLIIGGNETTRHASAAGMLAFIEKPEAWARLADDPSLLDSAVEEVLRWTAPGLHVLRTAVEDVRVGGQLIRAGDAVTIWNPSANRDEDAFPCADEFDVSRTPNRHLTFGIGEHYCIGGALARLELRVLLEETLEHVESIELAGPVQRLRSNFMWGLTHMPIHISGEIPG
jgi:cytochrome P450